MQRNTPSECLTLTIKDSMDKKLLNDEEINKWLILSKDGDVGVVPCIVPATNANSKQTVGGFGDFQKTVNKALIPGMNFQRCQNKIPLDFDANVTKSVMRSKDLYCNF